jgi:putative molybdopterin biosynthesis protein
MSVYLHDIPLPDAQQRLRAVLEADGLWGVLGTEQILLDEQACGRVLADAIWAKLSSPHYHASAMDGFAVQASSTNDAMPTAPVVLALGSQAIYVDTGDPLPEWADAVVPIENTEPVDEAGNSVGDVRQPPAIRIRAALPPWQHVRPMGEDIVATQLVLPTGHILRPVDLGAIAACGHDRVRVTRRPRVAVIPTGTELVPVGKTVKAGDIIEFNSMVIAAQVNSWGGVAERYPITPDVYQQIRDAVQYAAARNDLVLINAGSSAGSEDFTAGVIDDLGEVLVHGVAVRPGHPVILGVLKSPTAGGRAVPVIGIPGYPVSAALTGEIFVKPLLELWQGKPRVEPPVVRATLTRKVTSPAGDDDYLRVVVGRVDDRLLAAPLSRGAGVITSLVRADGITILPRGLQGLPAGVEVDVRLYRSPQDLERTIFAIGSHDLIMDLLAQFLEIRSRRLVSVNVGSQGGLIALRRGEAHLAGSHLLDAQSGEFNIPYIRQYLPGIAVRLVALVERQQGLMVLPGNPKQIYTLADLARPDVVIVNRQRGAGTRILLDYQLEKSGISSDQIRGYTQEEYTHLAVAAAVASGRSDCGLGIAAAAQALNLDFVPLFSERYDLVIPEKYADHELLAPLWQVLEDKAFRQAVVAMPGYNLEPMGQLVARIG